MPTITTVDTTWTNGVAMDEAELRRADSTMFLGDGSNNGVRGGIVYHGPSSLAVSINGSDQVTVQSGAAVIPAATGLGVYRASLQAATAATAIDPRNATNPRIDLVVFRSTGAVDIITGTPGASPSAPAVPAQAIELGRITVPAVGGGAATVSNSFRQYATTVGGTLYVETAARLPGSGNQKGQRAVAIDTGAEHIWNGTAWAKSGLTDFTPNLVNLPINGASSYAAYRRIGLDLMYVEFAVVASGAASGVVSISLPALAVIRFGSNNQVQAWGQATATDVGTKSWPMFIRCDSSSAASFLSPDGDSNISAASPFTWGAGDTLAGSFMYPVVAP